VQHILLEHLDAIWRTARRLGVPAADLDDVAQEVAMVVMQRESAIMYRFSLQPAGSPAIEVHWKQRVFPAELPAHTQRHSSSISGELRVSVTGHWLEPERLEASELRVLLCPEPGWSLLRNPPAKPALDPGHGPPQKLTGMVGQ
jgi:hypothetical protein